jgi:hypothetical protein
MKPIAVIGLTLFASAVHAHPVPRQYYDRTIEVHLAPGRVVVEYRLDVDALTVYDDLGEFSKEVNLPSLTRPEQVCQAFNQSYATILANNLVAKVDGKELTFRCTRMGHAARDENGQLLDHLRCELRFESPWTATATGRHSFSFRESNYELATGRVRLSLSSSAPLTLLRKTEPDQALKARLDADLRPGDAEKLRTVSATFTLPGTESAAESEAPPTVTEPDSPSSGTSVALAAAIAVVALAGLLFLGRQLRRVVRS